MARIGVISDTHGYIDDNVLRHFERCDQIWHAGDIGKEDVIQRLASVCEVKAVYGNIDDHNTRLLFPEINRFRIAGSNVFMTHIAGYPGRYNSRIKSLLSKERPDIVVCGHSHILRVIYDKALRHLHINPGAAGISGFHKIRTLVRFQLNEGKFSDMEIIEMDRRSAQPVG